MNSQNSLPQGQFVIFDQSPDTTIGYCNIKVPIPVYSSHSFDDYRQEARKVLKVLHGQCTQEEVLELPEFGYNAMGCNTFLAALAYEIFEQESHL